ncbi:MAG: hypothetical protein KIH63_002430 [Candidatus Saccharibacteria bacterium]|nr:hypothetical protein [Candidatus Saccharibacteria bacterium]
MSIEAEKIKLLCTLLWGGVGIYSLLHFRLRIMGKLRRKHSQILVGFVWVGAMIYNLGTHILQIKTVPSLTVIFMAMLVSGFVSLPIWIGAEGYYRNARGRYDIKDD